MRHRKTTSVLDRTTASRAALIRGLVTNLVEHGSIVTTPARAKVAQQRVERLITKSRGAATRNHPADQYLYSVAARKNMRELVTKYQDRKGGYTRITKMLPRSGDGSAQAKLEFI